MLATNWTLPAVRRHMPGQGAAALQERARAGQSTQHRIPAERGARTLAQHSGTRGRPCAEMTVTGLGVLAARARGGVLLVRGKAGAQGFGTVHDSGSICSQPPCLANHPQMLHRDLKPANILVGGRVGCLIACQRPGCWPVMGGCGWDVGCSSGCSQACIACITGHAGLTPVTWPLLRPQ